MKPMHLITKKTNILKKRPTILLQYIKKINKRATHQTDVWRIFDCFSHGFGDSESDFESSRVKKSTWPRF